MTNLDARISLQRSRFSLIQQATDFDSENTPRSNRPLVNAQLDMLERNWSKFQEEHENLCLSVNEDWSEHSYLKERVYERCQAFYIFARAKLHNHLEDFESNDRQSRTMSSELGATTSLMPRSALPRIKLPSFSGDYQMWRSFHDLFASLIKDNQDLTNVEKMHYLKTCVTGEAARLISNLSIAGDNFHIAWNLLVSRYENKRFLIATQLDRIHNLKPLKTKSAQGLRTLSITISEATAALRSLDCAVEYWDPLLLHHIVKLLDSESREAWEINLGSTTSYPTYVQFEKFLMGRTRALENLDLNTIHGSSTTASYNKQKSKFAALTATPSSNFNPSTCPLCGLTHHLSRCESYLSKTASQRKELIIKNKRCFNCLAPHLVKKCVSTRRCMKCGKRHHTTIHSNIRESSSTHTSKTLKIKPTNQTENKALLRRENSEPNPIRLLIDQGSELSFITEELVQRAQLTRKAASIPLLGIGGTYSGRTKGCVCVDIQSIHDSDSICTIRAYILPRLTAKLPSYSVDVPNWPHISGLPLADPEFSYSGPIDLIIGSDNYHSIIQPGLIPGDSLTPTAQQTIFGWVLCGPIAVGELSFATKAHHCSPDLNLQDLISRFWIQEEFPNSTNIVLNEDEQECERHFASSHSRDTSGRYIVRLPLKSDPSVLGNSRAKAIGCLNRLFHQLSVKESFQKLYVEFIEEYRRLGHMIEVETSSDQSNFVHYLPHHGILRESSRTTKLRVVFNGSSRTSNGLTLNDILHQGAKLQTDICDILLWTRTHKVLFSTDIVKMFRQIAVHPEDWDLQRILWYGENKQLLTYRLTTVTYGLNCAPFLALRTLQQLVIDEGHRYPKAVTPMTRGRYVDDIFGGADSTTEAKKIIQELVQLCDSGGFPLQKWSSNHQEILPTSSENGNQEIVIEPTLCKILGLVWRPTTDSLHFFSTTSSSNTFTKRTIASDIAKLYDPLGLISPVLIRAKIILQELWLTKIGWDEPLPIEIQNRWSSFRRQLSQLETLSIPRWLGVIHSDTTKIEIHGFSDASQLAMAAVVYIKISKEDTSSSVNLICSKTRVAPLKRLTIPRLELAAALLLARLITKTIKALDLPSVPVFCWSDSSVALTWIAAHPSRWKDFVRNRVSTIQEVLPNGTWRYVPGKDNPADLASRGLKPEQLTHQNLWWKGPKWLSKSSTFWPSLKNQASSESNLEERPGFVLVSLASRNSYWNLLSEYSSLTRLMRITATCRRCISCMRVKVKVPHSSPKHYPITPLELLQSRNFWIQIVQRVWFQEEIRNLNRGGQLPKSNPLARLTPFIDRDGLLRVGGRLHYAQIDAEAKHPFILPRRSPLTTLVIADAHRRSLHGGTQVTLSILRETFWVIGGRAPVRSYILRCTRCARYRGIRAKQLMGNLPATRVTPTRPFYNSGLDYAGPVTLRTWKGRAARTYKGYLSIFVCLATSAVHVEVVTDYTKEAFIAAYKRFSGRRGICATLQSDCGTNFVGADAELKRLFQQSSQEFGSLAALLATDGTEWRFNPPSAPHFGGKWEAAVKSVKYHLKRVLGDTIITYEEMTTVTTQIEAVLNSRPLCPLSDDINDYTVLTPGHFLMGQAPTALPEPNLSTEPISRLTRWQLLRRTVEHFWTRWSTECLQRYQAISKWHHPSNEIKKGSLVLITDERYPPGKWPLARVSQLHPGPDGLTRVVTLKTPTSSYKRPIAKLCVLPTNPDLSYSSTPLSKAGGNVTESIDIIDSDLTMV